ncbi:MAG: fold metallo-hydrolase [Bacteroidota bacterium]|nr:fold metallo-hydrolase [Bacteroidota bacterium]
MEKIEPAEFAALAAKGHAIVDARKSEVFTEGFIKGSVSIPFSENFLVSVDELISHDLKLLVVADEVNLIEILKMLKGSGLFEVAGYLDGGYDTWANAGNKFDMIITVDEDEFAIDYQYDEFYLVDIRNDEEFKKEHVEDSENIALIDIEQIIVELENDLSYYLYGNTAAEAITAASLFKKNGIQRVRAVAVEYEKIKTTNIPFFSVKKKGSSSTKFPNSGPVEN